MTDHIAVLEEIREHGQFPHWLDLVDVANALDAAIALMRGQSWQPIETAPKDGIAILGYSDGAMATVRWCALGNYWELVVVGGWAEDDEWEPTHWQPLPTPPKDTADEQ